MSKGQSCCSAAGAARRSRGCLGNQPPNGSRRELALLERSRQVFGQERRWEVRESTLGSYKYSREHRESSRKVAESGDVGR